MNTHMGHFAIAYQNQCIEFWKKIHSLFCLNMHTVCRIDANFLIKITDFGLSEDVFMKEYILQAGQ